MTSSQTPELQAPPVPFNRVGGFVRQMTHDIRNNLNSLDLQAAFLQELVTDAEALDEVKRLRALVQTSARQLQQLSSNFWTGSVNLVTYQASILVEDFQDRLKKVFPEGAAKVDWDVQLGQEYVAIDLEMLFGAWQRIFENAFQFAEKDARVQAAVFVEKERFVLEMCEPKSSLSSDPAVWGKEPFISSKRGGYGLGLFRAASFLAVQNGDLQYNYDSGRTLLVTRVTLPLASPE